MTQKAARDLKVGDVIADRFGGQGVVSRVDKDTTPGVVYVYCDERTDYPADLIYNHGDSVHVVDRPKLEDVIKLARQLKEEYDYDWVAFRANPHAYAKRASFIVDGDEVNTTAAAIRLLMDVM